MRTLICEVHSVVLVGSHVSHSLGVCVHLLPLGCESCVLMLSCAEAVLLHLLFKNSPSKILLVVGSRGTNLGVLVAGRALVSFCLEACF